VSWINGGDARPKFGNRPYQAGVGKRPTLVDNVETLAHLGLIARFGADWFRLLGPPDEPGSMLVTVTGGVDRPGVYEVAVGVSLSTLLDQVDASPPQALLVGGYFGTWVGGDRLADVPLSTEGLATIGGRLGCGVIVVIPDDACAWSEVATVAEWYAAHSAGQCGPCVFGLGDIARAVGGILDGDPEAEVAARRWTAMVRGRGACQFPDGAAGFVDSALEALSAEVSDHRLGRCARRHRGYLPAPAPESWR
jgi:NADH:ubiquinone oxidoreductase subunit F (NADH-binding)